MHYTQLGHTGTKVSRICIGGFNFGNKNEWELRLDQARLVINRAVDLYAREEGRLCVGIYFGLLNK